MAFLGRIRELAKIVGLDDPRVQRVVEIAERFPESLETGERCLRAMAREKGISLATPPLFHVPRELPSEGTVLGRVLRGEMPVGEYRYDVSQLAGNVAILGVTGCGKSTLVKHLCEGWIEAGLCVIVFDVGDEYGDLIHRFGPDKLLVIRARNFPLALFANPPGSRLSDVSWLSQVVSVLRETQYLRDGSCNLLLKVVGDMYRERGVFEGSGHYPVATEVFAELISRKFSAQSRHAGYLETLVNRAQALLQSFPNFNARRSPAPAQVMQRSLVVRMADLSPSEHDVFLNLFQVWQDSARVGELRTTTDVVNVVEEAHIAMSRQKMWRFDLGEPLTVRELRTCRKRGLSLVIVDQVPSELPAAVLGNVSTRIVFRLTNSPCLGAIEDSMGLNREQVTELSELPRRRAVVQSASQPKPFLMEVIDVPRGRPASREELEERERISLELLDYEPAEVDVSLFLFGGPRKKSEQEKKEGTLGGDLHKVMARLCERPYELIEERAEALEMDRAREYRARQDLEKLGMIERAGKVGSRWDLYVPTSKGVRWASDLGLPVYRYKGSIEHEVMVRKVRTSMEDFSSGIEVIAAGEALGVSGLQPDLIARVRTPDGDSSRRVAVEICFENKPEYEAERVLRLLAIEQINFVVIVARNKTSANAIGRRLRQGAGGMKVLDFETCVSRGYDWGWLVSV
jgi:hypothetical protein